MSFAAALALFLAAELATFHTILASWYYADTRNDRKENTR